MDVSAPHTAHRGAFLRRSSETDRLACSRISAGTTCSGLGSAFRFIWSNSDITMAETASPKQLPAAIISTALCRFRYLHHGRDIQRRAASRARLTGSRARIFTLQVDLRRHRVGAHRTVYLSRRLLSQQRFHDLLLTLSD